MKPTESAEIVAMLGAMRRPGSYRKPGARDWARLERAVGGAIPEAFKLFATNYNGYRCSTAVFELNNAAFSRQGGIERVFGFGADYNLFDEVKTLSGRVPAGFLPFGEGGTGNRVCLDTNTKRGAVYYWDHELEHLGPWGCVAKAASTFDSFLRSLKPLKDE